MKKTMFFILIFMILAGSIFSQQMKKDKKGRDSARFFGPPVFLYDFYQFKSFHDNTTSHVDVHIGFCNNILQFVKESPTQFHSKYDLMIAVFNKKGNHVDGKTFSGDIFAESFFETNNNAITNNLKYSFNLIPGEYKVIIELTDLDSRKSLRRKTELNVRGFQAKQVGLSNILFTNKMTLNENILTIRGIEPDINRTFNDEASAFWACFEIYPVSETDSLVLDYLIKDISDKTITSKREILLPDSGILPYTLNLKEIIKDANKYTLSLVVHQNDTKVEISSDFSANWRYFESSELNTKRAIEPLKNFVDDDEWDFLIAASENEKDQWFEKYWKERDPTSGTEKNELMEEFYRRIDFVNYNFSVNGVDKNAWETDRGKIYMKYGSPTNVERHASDLNIPPYEIWFYVKVNRRFVFEDRSGTGEFILVKVE